MDRSHTTRNFDVKIVQWNAQSLKPKNNDFEALLCREKIHIAIISETWLDPETVLNLSNYQILRKDRADAYGGVAIIVHRSIKIQVYPTVCRNIGIELLHLRLMNCRKLEHIIAVYIPSLSSIGRVQTCQADWDQLFSTVKGRCLIAGDFNAHHTSWSYKNDSRGNQLFDSALEYNYVSLNTGQATRVKLVNGILQETSPDVSFVSSDIATNFDWRVLHETLGSDHLVIRMSFSFIDTLNFVSKRNFASANWSEYSKFLTQHLSDYNGNLSIPENYDYFVNQINKSASLNIPLVKICTDPTTKFCPKSYWEPSLSHNVAQRRLALKEFRKNPTPYNLTKLEKKSEEVNF